MNADPFRPLPSEAQYRADMAQLDEELIARVIRKTHRPRFRLPSRPLMGVVGLVCIGAAYAILTWGARL